MARSNSSSRSSSRPSSHYSTHPKSNQTSSNNPNNQNQDHSKNTNAPAPQTSNPVPVPAQKPSFLGDIASTASGVLLGNALFHTIFGNKTQTTQPNQTNYPTQQNQKDNICQQKFDEYMKCVEKNNEKNNDQNSFPDNNTCYDKLKLFEDCVKSHKNVE